MLVNKRKLLEFVHAMQRMDGHEPQQHFILNNLSMYHYAADGKSHFKHSMYLYKSVRLMFFNCKGEVQIRNLQNGLTIVIPQKEILSTIAEIFANKGHPQLKIR